MKKRDDFAKKTPIAWFMNLSIRKKLTASLLLTALTVSMLVGGGCYSFFILMFKSEYNHQVTNTMDTLVENLNAKISGIYQNATYAIAKNETRQLHNLIEKQSAISVSSAYTNMQEIFDALLRSDELINMVMIIGKNGELFSTFEIGLRYDARDMPFWRSGIVEEIQWLEAMDNPFFTGASDVIPIHFPASYNPSSLGLEDRPMMLTVLLDASAFTRYMEQMNKTISSLVYIADTDGNPLSLTQNAEFYSVVSSPDFCKAIAQEEDRHHIDYHTDGSTYNVATESLRIGGLRVVTFVSNDRLMVGNRRIMLLTLSAMAVSFLLAVMISFRLGRMINGPILRLVQKVNHIREGNYELEPVTVYRDEMQILDGAINDMTRTIRQQFLQIKQEEKLKRKAEIDALAEQINPHFLYNTLDSIRWEVLEGNSDVAGNMIEDLGCFLRLSLNQGDELMTVAIAVLHMREYINLMNRRLDRHIQLYTHITEEASEVKMPKLILQPLAENAVIHGFGGHEVDPAIQSPTITVQATIKDNWLTLTVEDNGRGIDIEKANQAMRKAQDRVYGHIGLYNIYHRLLYIFGPDANITFSSIPYYRNTVTLHFSVGRLE